MAKIVPYEQQTSTPVATLDRTSGALARMHQVEYDGLMRGAMDASEALTAREDEHGRAWAVESLAKARLDWTANLYDRQANADPGAPDFTKGIIADFDKYASDLESTAPTPAAKKYVKERMLDLRNMIGERSLSFEAQARIDYRNDRFNSAIDSTMKLVGMDPTQYEVSLAETLAVIDESALPPQQRSAMREKAVKSISEAVIWGQINKSPTDFLRSVGMYSKDSTAIVANGRTGNKAFDTLPFDNRMEMVTKALSMKNSLDSDARRAIEAEQKAAADAAMKEAWGRLYSKDGKTLTREYVESIRPLINDSEYLSLLKGMEDKQGGSESKSDPDAFRDVQKALYNNPELAYTTALRYHREGKLSNTDLSSALAKANELDRQGGPKTEFERTRQRIVGNLDPGPLVSDPVGRGRLAEALYEFDTWIERNGKVPDKDVAKFGSEIINRYRFINLSDTLAGLPQPRIGQIRRNAADPAGMQTDIGKAFGELKKAYQAKKITKEEYYEQASLLNKWLKATGANNAQNP